MFMKTAILISVLILLQKIDSVKRTSSLTFVIDDTTSMEDDIISVKSKTKEVFQAVLESDRSVVDNFILVTFNDRDGSIPEEGPGYYLRINTTQESDFYAALDAIDVDGGGITCSEQSMIGIELAINSSNPYSFFYVFTDAPARDYEKYDDVQRMASQKSTQISFLLTGDCGEPDSPEFKVYYKLANVTGGQVFNIYDRDNMENVLNYIIETVKTRRCSLNHQNFYSEGWKTFKHSFNTDNKVDEVILSLAGESSQLKVFYANGTEAMTTQIVKTDRVLVVKMTNVVAGTYNVEVKVRGEADLNIQGACSFSFQHGFSPALPTSFEETVALPVSGQKVFLSIQVENDDNDVIPQSAQIRDMLGNTLMVLSLRVLNDEEQLYVTDDFIPPDHLFKIAVVGQITNNNEQIVRVSTSAITPLKVTDSTTTEAITSTTESSLNLMEPRVKNVSIIEDDDQSLKVSILCVAEGNPGPDIIWEDKNGDIFEVSNTESYEKDGIFEIKSVLVLNSPDDNEFTCNARNIISSSSETVALIRSKEPPLIDKTKNEYFQDLGESITLLCRIQKGKPYPDITWFFMPKLAKEYIKLDHNTEEQLQLSDLKPESIGFYKCEAYNSAGNDSFEMTVIINYSTTTKTITSTTELTLNLMEPWVKNVSIIEDDDQSLKVSILCVAEGNPEPEIIWEDKNGDIFEVSNTESYEKDGIFEIKSVLVLNSPDDNEFTCNARNIINSSSETVALIRSKEPPLIDKTKNEYFQDLGESVTLLCRIQKGKPYPDITWFFMPKYAKEYIKLDHNTEEEMYLSDLKPESIGFYKCEAYNSAGNDSFEMTVMIKYDVTTKATTSTTEIIINFMEPLIKSLLKINDDEESGNVSILCLVSGNPEPDIIWKDKNDVTLTTSNTESYEKDGIFEIKSVLVMNVWDENTFTCYATNDLGSTSDSFTLKRQKEPPLIDKRKKEYFQNIDKSVILLCRIKKGKPKPEISWLFMPNDATEYTKLDNNTENQLHLPNLQPANAGLYKCEAHNSAGDDSLQIRVIVLYAPYIEPENDVLVKEVGNTVYLNCIVSGWPQPSVRWYDKKGREIINGGKYIIHRNYTLSFKVKEKDSGEYKCEATNPFGTANRTVDLTAYIHNEIMIDPPKENKFHLLAGDSITLECNSRGFPKPTIRWMFSRFDSGGKITELSVGSTITLIDLRFDDAGYYMCFAQSIGGSGEPFTYEVYVEAPPTFENPFTTIYAVHNDLVKLPCIVNGRPTPTVQWLYNEYQIILDKQFMVENNTLLIRDITVNDHGVYKCVATNSQGSNFGSYDVIVFPTPNKTNDVLPVECVRRFMRKSIKCNINHNIGDNWMWFSYNKRFAPMHELIILGRKIDSGIYICRVSNFEGAKNYYINVEICYKPEFDDDVKDTLRVYTVGSNLDCFAHGNPYPQVTWKENEDILSQSDFTITSTSISKYMCYVYNEMGTINKEFNVIDGGCIINMTTYSDEQQPLIVYKPKTKHFENDCFHVPKGFDVTLSCPNSDIIMNDKNLHTHIVQATCMSRGSIFEVNMWLTSIDLSELRCSNVPPVHVSNTQIRCSSADNHSLIAVGYDVPEEKSSVRRIVYHICFNHKRKESLYSRYILTYNGTRTIPQFDYESNRYMKNVYDDSMYNCNLQRMILYIDFKKSFGSDEEFCFVKRQLVIPQGIYPSYEGTAFNLINVVPHFGPYSHNWNEVERRVLDKARNSLHDLMVYTGVHGYCELKTSFGIKKKLMFYKRSVPELLWTIVLNRRLNSAVVIIQINIPALSPEEVEEHVYCPNICDKIEWLRNEEWSDPEKGYVYCCTLKSFLDRFKGLLYVKNVKGLLK